MSSLPGLDLEDFVTWWHRYDFAYDPRAEAAFSVSLAEFVGTTQPRPLRLTDDEFARVVRCYEPHRETIEIHLDMFEEECMSWRDYSMYSNDWVSGQSINTACAVVSHIRAQKALEEKEDE